MAASLTKEVAETRVGFIANADAPRSPARDRRRQAILVLARETFEDQGYANTSMSCLAARLGGSKGTLYNYFSSKEALLAAVVTDYCARIRARICEPDADNCEIIETLRRLGRSHVELMLSVDVLSSLRLAAAESSRFPDIAHALYEAGPLQSVKNLVPHIITAMAKGELQEANPSRAAQQFLDLCLSGLWHLGMSTSELPPTASQVDANVNAAVEIFSSAYLRTD